MSLFNPGKKKTEVKPLEERVKKAGITFGEPSENGYVEGELNGSGTSREAAEDNLLSRAQTYGVTNIGENLIYSRERKLHKVKAAVYRPASLEPEPAA